MPRAERARILALVEREPCAKAELARLRAAAEKGDGYSAAFLYALEGDSRLIPVTTRWLLKRFGPKAWFVRRARDAFADPDFFEGGQPHLADVYYQIDVRPFVAFDWAYTGLDPADRKTIEAGILDHARFRIRAMDRWSQTPNLVFKPTYVVAMVGLATQDAECLQWGFRRQPRHGNGGYFVALDQMLLDGGPWREAPIYPIAHKVLYCAATMSLYRSLYDGRDWFSHRTSNGSCPKGLMDYYIETAYPIERTGHGPGQIRVATYGDGATNAEGKDLFLVNPAAKNLNAHEALTAAWRATGDSLYAPFVAMVPDWRPSLLDRRTLPAKLEFPPAPSKIWPTYGLAILRSDESPHYWTSGKAIAVFQLMSHGYGHDHRDKFSIMLHGAGRLFYPDYNPIQYENPAVGWTRNSPCHNTLIVDEQETANAAPTGIRHEFAPEVKFLATSASGVFEGVDQTRALLLPPEYLLDVFHASSQFRHTYDYVLHSFGKPSPAAAERFRPSNALVRRYWLMKGPQAMTTGEPWSLDFTIEEKPGSREGNYGKAWYDHRATLRLTMAAAPETLVSHGVDVHGVPMLVARRNCRDTVFVATHEPVAAPARPQVRAVAKLAETTDALLVRVDAKDFTDYAAIAFGPQEERPEHVLGDGATAVAFRGHGYLRVARDGAATGRGGWTRLRIPGAGDTLILNGRPVEAKREGSALVYGGMERAKTSAREPGVECPLAVETIPRVVRVFDRDRRPLTFRVRNTLRTGVSGRIQLDLPEGFGVEPLLRFGPIAPGGSADVRATFVANQPRAGKQTIPYRTIYREVGAKGEVHALPEPLAVAVGPTLEFAYQHPDPNVYVVHCPRLTAKLHMFHGMVLYLADDDDTVRLDGSPLFTFTNGKEPMLAHTTDHATTWPRRVPASLTAAAYDRCRWHALFFGDRLMFRMDRDWTQFETATFTIPGEWVSPAGPPRWRRIIAVDGHGKEHDAKPGPAVKVVAAELGFPDGGRSVAFQFVPPRQVAFDGAGLTFKLPCLTGDHWTVGFCAPDQLHAWRWRK
ncbi:MAG: hypothetical protein ACOC8A_00565 [bacterium]